MSNFRYSDKGDVLTQQLIAEGFDSAYWEESEEKVLDRAISYIEKKYGREDLQYRSVLDLGCGTGRLLPRFSMLFSSVTGLEPDEERCDEAMELILDRGLENATALSMDLDEYIREFPNQTFDVVLCSHVFQHMSHETACGILERLREVLTPDSVCIFTTTFTDASRNDYTFEFLQDGDRIVLETDEKGFDEAVRDPDELAVCLFARPWMERFLLSCGLKTADFQAYHFMEETDASQDAASSGDPDKLLFARDALYICEPLEGTLLRQNCGPSTASGKICMMYYYTLNAAAVMNTSRLSKLQSEETEDTEEVRDAVTAAETFLYGGTLRFPAKRHYRSVEIRSEKAAISDSHVIVSLYPGNGVAQVSVNLSLEDAPCDDFIYLHQVLCAKDDLFLIDGEPGSLPGFCEKILKECADNIRDDPDI